MSHAGCILCPAAMANHPESGFITFQIVIVLQEHFGLARRQPCWPLPRVQQTQIISAAASSVFMHSQALLSNKTTNKSIKKEMLLFKEEWNFEVRWEVDFLNTPVNRQLVFNEADEADKLTDTSFKKQLRQRISTRCVCLSGSVRLESIRIQGLDCFFVFF